MSRFIYVFSKEGYDDQTKKGHMLMWSDEKNQVWVFENPHPEDLEFEADYQVVLSNVLPF